MIKGDLRTARPSKFERDLQSVEPSPPAPTRKETRRLDNSEFLQVLRKQRSGASDPAVRLAYRCLLEQFERMLGEEPRAREGLDPEGVHQMRVASRRIRAAFRAFKGVLPAASVKEFNGDFKWIAAVLGDVRDLDVDQDNFPHYTAGIPEEDLIDYRKHLAELWQQAREGLLTCLSSQRYKQLRDGFTEFLQRGPSETAMKTAGTLSIRDAAVRLIGRQCKRVVHDGRAITSDSPDETLHSLRIDCKRLRYLFEFYQPIYGKSLHPFVKRLKQLQGVLGEFQDACIAMQRLGEYAERVPMQAENRGQLIALGQLVNAQRQKAADRRGRFHKVWKSFDRKCRRKQIVRLLDSRR